MKSTITFAAEPNQRPAGHLQTDFQRHPGKISLCKVPCGHWIDGHAVAHASIQTLKNRRHQACGRRIDDDVIYSNSTQYQNVILISVLSPEANKHGVQRPCVAELYHLHTKS